MPKSSFIGMALGLTGKRRSLLNNMPRTNVLAYFAAATLPTEETILLKRQKSNGLKKTPKSLMEIAIPVSVKEKIGLQLKNEGVHDFLDKTFFFFVT